MNDYSTDEIQFERRGPSDAWGVVTLTRPKALNSLTLGMCQALDAALTAWAVDPTLRAVIVQGEGDRAFCAGGDIRYMHDTAKTDAAQAADFFRAEYRMNTRMHRYQKPIVALMDGITMGGGVGVSAPARHRVATDRTMWAMPECAIGLIPDVGASHHLTKLPDGAALWLGLTGERLDGEACVALGLADYLIPSDALADLTEALLAEKLGGNADKAIERVLGSVGEEVGNPPEWPSAFEGSPSLTDLVETLRQSDEEGAAAALAKIEAGSPTSLALTHRAILGAPAGFGEAITREFRIAAHLMEGPDFIEGVRAQVIDKDRQPKWSPADLGGVTDEMLDRYFTTPTGGDLDLDGV